MLTHLGIWANRLTAKWNPWTNVVGVARTLMALATASTLATNDTIAMFPAVPASMLPPPYCVGVRHLSAYCLVPTRELEVVRWLSVFALLVVASGYRPRITGLVHAWISFSFAVSSPLLDGGDQVASALTLLLLPVTLTDPRKWHWSPPAADTAPKQPIARLVTRLAMLLAQLQVAGIYFHAAVGKTAVDDWANGTALYYWVRHPMVGAAGVAAKLMYPLTEAAVPLALLTWGVIGLEFLLAGAILCPERVRRYLLPCGIALHVGIIVIHGLISFGLTMIAAVILYLRPLSEPFPLALVRDLRRPWLARRGVATRGDGTGAAAPSAAN